MTEKRPLIGIGTVVLRETVAGLEVLLIKRGRAPRVGEWSIPGGKQDWGETVRAAAAREVREETGIEVEILGLIDVVDSLTPTPDKLELSHHYTLIDFAARPIGGVLQAGDDAMEARWVPIDQLEAYALWRETIRMIHRAIPFLT